MLSNWDKLLHPLPSKWKTALAATVEGWTLFATADAELRACMGSNIPAQNDINARFRHF